MQHEALSSITNTIIESTALVDSDEYDSDDDVEEYIEKLRFLFSENLLLAALDLVDRECVIKYVTPWGHSTYHVLGSTTTYTVFPGSHNGNDTMKIPPYCTCPAFAYSVLLSGTEVMCKHLLATKVAVRLSKCMERTVTRNDLADFAVRRRP